MLGYPLTPRHLFFLGLLGWNIGYFVLCASGVFSNYGNDLTIYLRSLERFAAEGPAGIYRIDQHSFLYTPLIFLLISPLKHLSLFSAFVGIGLLNTVALLGSFKILLNWIKVSPRQEMLIAILAFVSIMPFWTSNIRLGQVNFISLFFILASFDLHDRGRSIQSGLYLALATSIKITPLLLVIYFLVKKDFKVAATTLITVIALNIGAAYWIAGDQLFSLFSNYHHTLDYWGEQHLASWDNHSVLRAWAQFLPITSFLKYSLAMIGSLLVFLIAYTHHEQPFKARSLIILLVLLISPVIWKHHLVLMLPAILYLTALAVIYLSPGYWVWYGSSLFLATSSLNILKSLGSSYGHKELFGYLLEILIVGIVIFFSSESIPKMKVSSLHHTTQAN